ncbi:hypothetical protein ACROYT_G015506 [Oculina patagonica]
MAATNNTSNQAFTNGDTSGGLRTSPDGPLQLPQVQQESLMFHKPVHLAKGERMLRIVDFIDNLMDEPTICEVGFTKLLVSYGRKALQFFNTDVNSGKVSRCGEQKKVIAIRAEKLEERCGDKSITPIKANELCASIQAYGLESTFKEEKTSYGKGSSCMVDLNHACGNGDKGRVTVVMDKTDYYDKMDALVNDKQTYEVLKRDPTPALQLHVDDTFTAVHKDEIDDFHKHLNEQNADIQFTREIEENGKLPFLDCLVSRDNNKIRTTVYRKPTHTDRLLDETSYNPTSHKATTIKTLTKRAQLVCDTPDSLSDENKYLDCVFHKNNYNTDFIRRNTHRTTETDRNLTSVTTATLPYIKGTSETIARILQPYNIRVAHKPITTLRHLLTNVKDRDEPNNRQGAIYKIKCSDCQASYIGETGRNLTTRLTEHKRATRNGDVNNHISEHHRLTKHKIDWDSAECFTYSTIFND